MRYIILNKNITKEERNSRKLFIEKVTNLYFIPYMIECRMELRSIPSSINDSLMIVGHNLSVNNYIKNNLKNSEKIKPVISLLSSYRGTDELSIWKRMYEGTLGNIEGTYKSFNTAIS